MKKIPFFKLILPLIFVFLDCAPSLRFAIFKRSVVKGDMASTECSIKSFLSKIGFEKEKVLVL